MSKDSLFKKPNMKKTSITLDYEEYQLFKSVCYVNNSDASKEIRKYISEYIQNNQETVMKLKTQH